MAASTTFEIGDLEYEVVVDSFSPPTRDTRDCPGDGGEVCAKDIVHVLKGGQKWDVVTYNTFLLYLAAETQVSLREAENAVTDALFEVAYEDWSDRRDDEYEGRGRSWRSLYED